MKTTFDFSHGIHMQKMSLTFINSVLNGRRQVVQRYVTPGVHEGSAVKYIDTRILKATRLANTNNFKVLNDYCIKGFDL